MGLGLERRHEPPRVVLPPGLGRKRQRPPAPPGESPAPLQHPLPVASALHLERPLEEDATVNVSVVDGTEWRPSNVVELEINNLTLSSPDDHRLNVIVDGDEEVFEFYVP